jgi:hypothetical protein
MEGVFFPDCELPVYWGESPKAQHHPLGMIRRGMRLLALAGAGGDWHRERLRTRSPV